MKCNKCGYDDNGSGDMAHVCQRPSFRYGEHPTSFGLFNPKQEPVAWMNDEGDVVTDQKWAKDQRYTIPLYTIPPQRKTPTDEMVTAAARVLNERQADACGVDRDDQWAIYGSDFKADALAMLKAAHGIKE